MKITSKWKINDNPILIPTSFSGKYTRQAKTADRSESGIYDDDRIQDGIDFDIEFKPRSWEEMSYMMSLLSEGQYFNFTYKSPKDGEFKTQTFYCGERSFEILRDVDGLSLFSLSAHIVSKNGDEV